MNITYYNDIKNINYSLDSTAFYIITEDIDLQELRQLANNNFYGAIAPHIIVGDTLHESGVLQITFTKDEDVKFHMLDMRKTQKVNFKESSTLLMFSDTLNEFFEPFIERLDDIIVNQTLFGSGVGSKEFKTYISTL